MSARTNVRSNTSAIGLEFARLDNACGWQPRNLWIDWAKYRELAQHDLVGRKCNQGPAGHCVDWDIDGHFGFVRFHRAGDLHRGQHEATRCMQYQIYRNVRGRLLDRGNDGLGVLQVDVPGDREAEQAPLLLAMNHRDDTSAVRPFNRPDRLGASDGIPSPHEEGLQSHDEKEDPKQ